MVGVQINVPRVVRAQIGNAEIAVKLVGIVNALLHRQSGNVYYNENQIYTSFPCHCSTGREKNKEGEFRMSERENDTKKMLETLRKLPEKTQEKIGYMIEGAALVSAASEDEQKKDGGAA